MRQVRRRLDLTQMELASIIGCRHEHISRMENFTQHVSMGARVLVALLDEVPGALDVAKKKAGLRASSTSSSEEGEAR